MKTLVIAALIIWAVVAAARPRGGDTEGFDPFFNSYACGDDWLWTRTRECRGATTGPVPLIDR